MQWVLVYSQGCEYHHYLILEQFHHPKKNPQFQQRVAFSFSHALPAPTHHRYHPLNCFSKGPRGSQHVFQSSEYSIPHTKSLRQLKYNLMAPG